MVLYLFIYVNVFNKKYLYVMKVKESFKAVFGEGCVFWKFNLEFEWGFDFLVA